MSINSTSINYNSSSSSSSSSSKSLTPINDQNGSKIYQSCMKEFNASFTLIKKFCAIREDLLAEKSPPIMQLAYQKIQECFKNDPLLKHINGSVDVLNKNSILHHSFHCVGIILQLKMYEDTQSLQSMPFNQESTLFYGTERLAFSNRIHVNKNFESSFILHSARQGRKVWLSYTRLDGLFNLSLQIQINGENWKKTALNLQETHDLCRDFLYMVDEDDRYSPLCRKLVEAVIQTKVLSAIIFDYLSLVESPLKSSLHLHNVLEPKTSHFGCVLQ